MQYASELSESVTWFNLPLDHR